MSDVTFEVMVCSTAQVGGLARDVWYPESAHEDHGPAAAQFEKVCRAHPDKRLLVVLVRSAFDERTLRFRDRELDAREPVARLVRASAPLTSQCRRRLREAFGSALSVDMDRAGAAKPDAEGAPLAKRSGRRWAMAAAGAGAAALCAGAVAILL